MSSGWQAKRCEQALGMQHLGPKVPEHNPDRPGTRRRSAPNRTRLGRRAGRRQQLGGDENHHLRLAGAAGAVSEQPAQPRQITEHGP